MSKKGRPFLIPSITMVPSLIGPFHHPLPTHSRQLQKGRELRKLPRKMRSNCMPNKGTTFYLKPTEVTFTITTLVSATSAMVAATPNPPAIPKPTAGTQSTSCVMCSSLGHVLCSHCQLWLFRCNIQTGLMLKKIGMMKNKKRKRERRKKIKKINLS